jgi:hypothetical protein
VRARNLATDGARAGSGYAPGVKRRKRRGSGAPRMLADVLEGAYPGRPNKPLIHTFTWWDRVVPERIAKNARPVDMKGGELIVHTKTSVWAQELSFHNEDLLRRIRTRVPAVKKLRVRIGPMPPAPPKAPPPPPKIPPLSIGQLPGDVARSLAHIGDDKLRAALTRAACQVLAPKPRKGRRP